MKYSFKEHLHNYSIWTSARAVQRNFTSTKNIKIAIEETNLKELIETPINFSVDQFDEFHRKNANIIIECFKSIDKKHENKATYGRAAKLIAIYLKTACIVPNFGKSILSKVAHPPIDRILLQNAHRENTNLNLNKINWTELNEEKYFELIKKLRTLKYEYFWEIERFWNPIQKE